MCKAVRANRKPVCHSPLQKRSDERREESRGCRAAARSDWGWKLLDDSHLKPITSLQRPQPLCSLQPWTNALFPLPHPLLRSSINPRRSQGFESVGVTKSQPGWRPPPHPTGAPRLERTFSQLADTELMGIIPKGSPRRKMCDSLPEINA